MGGEYVGCRLASMKSTCSMGTARSCSSGEAGADTGSAWADRGTV